MQSLQVTSSLVSPARARFAGFTIIECLASLALLGVICGGIVVTISRSMDLTEDLSLRVQAFTVARENLEQILSSVSLEESLEAGMSERYPLIEWETTLEVFNDPAEGNPWSRAICRASYQDHENEKQTVELIQWLGPVDEESLEGQGQGQIEGTQEFNYEEALEYANINEDTFGLWLDWGLKQLPNGDFIQYNLDIFIRANGAQPTEEELEMQVDTIRELEERFQDSQEAAEDAFMDGEDGQEPFNEGRDLDLSALEKEGGDVVALPV